LEYSSFQPHFIIFQSNFFVNEIERKQTNDCRTTTAKERKSKNITTIVGSSYYLGYDCLEETIFKFFKASFGFFPRISSTWKNLQKKIPQKSFT
jgi:hypothetical protein